MNRDTSVKIICLCGFLSLPGLAHAMFAPPVSVPVERLEKKAGEYVQAHPEDAMAWYTLGRIHYLALVLNSESLNGREGAEGAMPSLYHYQNEDLAARRRQEASRRAAKELGLDPQAAVGRGGNMNPEKARELFDLIQKISKELETAGQPASLKPEVAAHHANEALRCFDKAMDLRPNDALFLLGKASLLDQYMEAARQQFLATVATKPKAVSKEAIVALYLKAYDAAKSKDESQTHKPLLGLKELVSYEAGKAYLKNAPEGERAKEIAGHIAKLEALPMGPITPVLAAGAQSIQQLFNGERATFDITGLGWPQSYPWPGRRAAFVVWDPEHTGRITNGRQLFGFYTWGLFWQDGYQALSMLDDNSDGELAGGELEGISLWTDANSNGCSESGEVTRALDKGVKSISVHADGKEGIHPVCPAGITFHHESSWTSWDWMAEPLLSPP